MERDELAAWLRLVLTPGVGNDSARRLLAAFGLPQAIFDQPASALRQCVSAAKASALQSPPSDWQAAVDRTWQWLVAQDAPAPRAIVTLGDPAYPAPLLAMEDPPLMLYLTGHSAAHPPWEALRTIAIVGSRNPTPQGASNARAFAKFLGGSGLCVISGLALGIDGAAHQGALESAPTQTDLPATIALVGTGLDRVYPKRHLELAHDIAARGLIVSEYPLGTPALAANFPKRNRLIAGLSQGVLVVEAALQSGSLITARLASEQGKDVFAIPGSIHSPQSRGCHWLIKQGAKLVETGEDVLEELRLPTGAASARTGDTSVGRENDHPLLVQMGFDPVGIDALVARTGMDAATLQVQLLELELDGAVARMPGGLFQRQHSA
ncbi:MAG: DNA-processing protein DprA [Burkholderiales bacterium]